ncbi:MAG: HEAT repeat domain-containing protein, partial [Planctomycetales bacterium]|nr:HEAT repeat domain-containing protein [Planctomycetales bacterium]
MTTNSVSAAPQSAAARASRWFTPQCLLTAVIAALLLSTPFDADVVRGDDALKKKAAQPQSPPPTVAKDAEGLTPEAGDSSPAAESQKKPAAAEVLGPKVWHNSLAEGYTAARQSGRPLFVRGGASWCGPCRLLAEEIQKPELQAELSRWTLVYLDIDKAQADASGLGVESIPSLHLLTTSGKAVAAKEGFLKAEELQEWLQQNYEAARAAPPKVLAEGTTLDASQIGEVIRYFGHRDATLREAAIRRLLKHRDITAEAVIETFSDGKLAAQLSALELLMEWKAPLAGLDPWQPESLGRDKLTKLMAWGAAQKKTGDVARDALTTEELQDAKNLIARMLTGNAVEATAIRERLARHRELLLSLARAEFQKAETDEARERLLGLRYRLVASEALALNWPGGLERLAAASVETRRSAADELSKRAGHSEEALLRELFGDSAPLVREIALKTLRKVGGAQAKSSLLDLLTDPEPNVRAAVLKELAETPPANLIPRIIEYTKVEKDADLLVHAVRVLRESKGPETLDALTKLLTHESWRVRAEAAEGISKVASQDGEWPGEDPGGNPKANALASLIKLLGDSDGFVVSKAVAGLSHADLPAAVDPLAAAAEKHPELATEVLQALASSSKHREKAMPHLKRFCKHPSPALRAGALRALCSNPDEEMMVEIKAGLSDPAAEVRIAVAEGLYQQLASVESLLARFDVDFGDPGAVPEGAAVEEETTTSTVGVVIGSLWNLVRGKSATKVVRVPPVNEKVVAPVLKESAPGKTPVIQAETTLPLKTEIKKEIVRIPSKDANENDDLDAANSSEQYLLEIRKKRKFPMWNFNLVEPLKPLLKGDTPKERLAGAQLLAALGQDAVALPA